MRLEGKVAIISGGARGMGAAEARLFAREGAKVVIGDVLDDLGKQVESEIAEAGGEATSVHLDVTSEADWANAVQTAVSSYGKLDILVNNAGIVFRSAGDDASVEEWDRLMDVNAKGVFLGTNRERHLVGDKKRYSRDEESWRRLDNQYLIHIGHSRTK